MYENIIYIIFIIILLFFISNEEKINSFFSRKYFKVLFLLLIIYFVYEKYNLLYLLILLLVIMILNMDLSRFRNNKYLKNIENFISDSHNSPRGDQKSILSPFNIINFKKEIKSLEKTSELLDNGNLNRTGLPVSDGPTYEQALSKSVEPSQKIEPFKENVENIKELYNNIQNEINKLKEGN